MPSVAAHPRERFPKPCEHQDWFVQLKALADLKADLLQLRNRRRGAGVIEFIEFGVRLLRHNRRQGNILRYSHIPERKGLSCQTLPGTSLFGMAVITGTQAAKNGPFRGAEANRNGLARSTRVFTDFFLLGPS